MSPRSVDMIPSPLYASTPFAGRVHEAATSCNGLDQIDNKKRDANKNYEETRHTNGTDINVNVVTESINSIDILSGGESDAGDTLSRTKQINNNTLSSICQSLPDGPQERGRRRCAPDLLYCIAKELLMTERTYKRDLEFVTVGWSSRVSTLAGDGEELVESLGRPCLAVEPLALAQGVLLARLERALASAAPGDAEEQEYKKIGELLYDYLTSTYDAYWWYVSVAGALLARVESARRGRGAAAARAERAARGLERARAAPLPLAAALLRPLHRLLYYRRLLAAAPRPHELSHGPELLELCAALAEAAEAQLQHAENHAALCQLQRDIVGYAKLLVADREFLRLGCLYKHSNKGLQQRMFFLFSDILLCASKSGNAPQFRTHCVLPLHQLSVEPSEMPHTFIITGEDVSMTLSASSERESAGWAAALRRAAAAAPPAPAHAALTPPDAHARADEEEEAATAGGAALSHVCWHRATSLSREHLHLAMSTQLSGYLLRKFKNSHGWQKLWVVFAAFALFFYKSWQDDEPLASLPLLGYTVGAPSEADAINKEFVFKLQFKNHVYFFRADSHYTYTRWTESLQTAMVQEQ